MTRPESSITLQTIVVATTRQVDTQLDDDVVILNLENSIYYGFQEDPVAEAIWKAVQRPCSVADIIERILADFEVNRTQCEEDVLTFVSRLLEEQLIQIAE